VTDQLDPGAYIGNEPEREAETIPGGVTSQDERTSAYDSRPGLPDEPSDDAWSDGGSTTGDVVRQPDEFEPLTSAADEASERTSILGVPPPD
jgi:hypothetical protein